MASEDPQMTAQKHFSEDLSDAGRMLNAAALTLLQGGNGQLPSRVLSASPTQNWRRWVQGFDHQK
jgi:hypothetical protein